MTSKLDTRQIISQDVLDQLSTTTGIELDNLLRSLNSNDSSPLKLSVTGANRVVNIGSIFVVNPETGISRTIPTIANVIPNFLGGTITAPATGAGTITVSPGTNFIIAMAASQFLKIGINIDSIGNISLTAGTAGASLAAATAPPVVAGTFGVGYVVLRTNGANNVQNILNSDLYQYVSSAVSGGNNAPVGAMFDFAGTVPPVGWIMCDGASLSTLTYPDLFSVIGHAYGGAGLLFNLPDFRGRFARYNDDMGTGAASRDTGRVLGSAQVQLTAKNGLTNSTSVVNGTTNVGHTHANSSVSGTTDIAHNHGASTVTINKDQWNGDQNSHRHTGYWRTILFQAGGDAARSALEDNTGFNAKEVTGGIAEWNSANATGSAGGQTLGSQNSSLNGGIATGQTLGSTPIALASGIATGQTLGTSNIALASGLANAQTITGDLETRPINLSCNKIIKF